MTVKWNEWLVTEKNYISISFQIEWDMIVVTVFLLILNQMEFHLVQNRRKTVTTIISHSMWKEMEMQFSQCRSSLSTVYGS